ncbi:hypothetical protein [Embleya sp. NBC_00888]|uniref:hypothetical protein n=1 Tax=Embleya sp. NBC_00888 TaxID=2975960 RepID=UPI002F90C316
MAGGVTALGQGLGWLVQCERRGCGLTFARNLEPHVLLERLGADPQTIAMRGQADNFDENGDEIHPASTTRTTHGTAG